MRRLFRIIENIVFEKKIKKSSREIPLEELSYIFDENKLSKTVKSIFEENEKKYGSDKNDH